MERPNDIETEIPILLWGKIICIEMMGNDNWKHRRDYNAVLDLMRRWKLIRGRIPELDKLYNKMEDQFIEKGEIDWDLLESARVMAHDYLREFENGKYNPDPNNMGMIILPDQWVIQRIRELTDS